jgi:hypothetical protein
VTVVTTDGVDLVDQPSRAVAAARFFVGDDVHQRPLRLADGPSGTSRRPLMSEVEHAVRAAPHLPIDQFAAERVRDNPTDGHDVGVAHQAKCGSVRIGAFDTGDH